MLVGLGSRGIRQLQIPQIRMRYHLGPFGKGCIKRLIKTKGRASACPAFSSLTESLENPLEQNGPEWTRARATNQHGQPAGDLDATSVPRSPQSAPLPWTLHGCFSFPARWCPESPLHGTSRSRMASAERATLKLGNARPYQYAPVFHKPSLPLG